MSLLKQIPIQYKGELHDVRLVNFSVSKEEVIDKVPANIKIRDFNGRAMISMVDVKLKNMRPTILPFVRFNYRHIAFRLLVDDSQYSNGANKGIFFLKSFTDQPWVTLGGKLMTDYNLERATIHDTDDEVTITLRNQQIKYCLDNATPSPNPTLTETIGTLDRAYAVLGDTIRVTEIQREKWPIQLVNCAQFENTFFSTAKFEGAFRVPETIYYEWLPPKIVQA